MGIDKFLLTITSRSLSVRYVLELWNSSTELFIEIAPAKWKMKSIFSI